jgi:hypothetical protein
MTFIKQLEIEQENYEQLNNPTKELLFADE